MAARSFGRFRQRIPPTFSVSERVKATILGHTVRLGLGIGIRGLFSIQFICDVRESDGFAIRQCTAEGGVTMFTALDTVRVLLAVLEEITMGISPSTATTDLSIYLWRQMH